MLKKLQIIILLLCTLCYHGQTKEDIKKLVSSHIKKTSKNLNLYTSDVDEWSVKTQYYDEKSKVTHVYGVQNLNGIEIYKATFNMHIINNNQVISYKNSFLKDKKNKTSTSSNLNGVKSITNILGQIAKQLNLSFDYNINVIEKASGKDLKQLIEVKKLSSVPIPLKLMYFLNEKEKLILVWDISIKEVDGVNWWSLKVDAHSGSILDKVSWGSPCSFSNHIHQDGTRSHNKLSSQGKHDQFDDFFTREDNLEKSFQPLNSNSATYLVYAKPTESPAHGFRTFQQDTHNPVASPFGWHDINGSPGAEYTDTRGNNVNAEAPNSFTPRPDGGSSLYFDFPIDTLYTTSNKSEDAAVTNLFYWNNIMHDVFFEYGFDEASGNFQTKNYSNVNTLGFDAVEANAQVNSSCNAWFHTPPDGQRPIMTMYIAANCDSVGLSRDTSLDNLVIAHEYGHGITKRLVGGSDNVNVLLNDEQMGEGWSDWFGLMLTIEHNDKKTDLRPVGTWLAGENIDDGGIRKWPYSTNMSSSPYTYNHIKNLPTPHGVGSVWASMLWEVTWELIDVYGYDSNLYTGTGGNNIAMNLVVQALKITPVSPGFVDARDAILLADQLIYNGENQCYLWNAFAKRGLGYNASQGSSLSNFDGIESFDIPTCHTCLETLSITQDVNSGQTDNQSAQSTLNANNTIKDGAIANYNAGSSIVLNSGFEVEAGAVFNAYIQGCSVPFSKIDAKSKKVKNGVENTDDEIKKLSVDIELIKIYPNPSTGIFYLSANNIISNYKVVNQIGKTILENKPSNKNFKVNLQKYPSGVYFIKVEFDSGESVMKKFIKN